MTKKQLLLNYLSIPDCVILVDGQMGNYNTERRIIKAADSDWFYLERTESDKINLNDFEEEFITLNREESRFQLKEYIKCGG